MDLEVISQELTLIGVPVYVGYAETSASLPYIVVRPLSNDPESIALKGNALLWASSVSVYCCASSTQASLNLAKAVTGRLSGKLVGDSVIECSIGYSGEDIEGRYESQVTISTKKESP